MGKFWFLHWTGLQELNTKTKQIVLKIANMVKATTIYGIDCDLALS